MKQLIFVLLLVFLFGACATTTQTQSAIISVPKFHKTVQFGDYKIHTVSARSQFIGNPAFYLWDRPNKLQTVDGFYDHKRKEIWILGKMIDGKVYPWSYCLAGHEFWHLLQYLDEDIGDPDIHP